MSILIKTLLNIKRKASKVRARQADLFNCKDTICVAIRSIDYLSIFSSSQLITT